jgi:hypothetical protein
VISGVFSLFQRFSLCFVRSVLGLVRRSLRFVGARGSEGGLGRGGVAVVLLGDYQAVRVWLFRVWIIKTCFGFFLSLFCEGRELWMRRLVVVFGRRLV